jgi:hypothetical protein
MPRTPPESDGGAPGRPGGVEPRKPYETPRLIDYGSVSKLTQTGGFTVADHGGTKQLCL